LRKALSIIEWLCDFGFFEKLEKTFIVKPSNGSVDVLLVGAGFAGIYLLDRLRDEGFKVKTHEAASGLGGIWHWNCYPGARVDSKADYYQFALKDVWHDWDWSERFPGWEEMRAYFRHLDRKLDLSRDICFSTWVRAARFDEAERLWLVESETVDGTKVETRAKFFVVCCGHGFVPYIPKFAGLDAFTGACYHTAQWPQKGVSMAGQRVGVIGTGASGIQVAQEAAKVARSLTLFQRTPAMCLPMRQRTLDAADNRRLRETLADSLKARENSYGGVDFDFDPRLAVDVSARDRDALFESLWSRGGLDYWLANFADSLSDPRANAYVYEFWRDKVCARIQDPTVAELLAPTIAPHPFGTRRVALEQTYYDLFNERHVELVDIQTNPIDEITTQGLRTRNTEFEFDLLVIATGFDSVTGGLTQIDIRGADGTSLEDKWSTGVRTYQGICTAGFPNLLFTYGPQAPTAFCNGPTSAEYQGECIVDCLRSLRDKQITRFEARIEEEKRWGELCRQLATPTLFDQANSWYMGANIPGKHREMLMFTGGLPLYLEELRKSHAAGYQDYLLD